MLAAICGCLLHNCWLTDVKKMQLQGFRGCQLTDQQAGCGFQNALTAFIDEALQVADFFISKAFCVMSYNLHHPTEQLFVYVFSWQHVWHAVVVAVATALLPSSHTLLQGNTNLVSNSTKAAF
jgi:hypothetical protein